MGNETNNNQDHNTEIQERPESETDVKKDRKYGDQDNQNRKNERKALSAALLVIVGIVAVVAIAFFALRPLFKGNNDDDVIVSGVVSEIDGVSDKTYEFGMKAVGFLQEGVGLPDYVPSSEEVASQMYLDMLTFYTLYDEVQVKAETESVPEVELCFLDTIFIALGSRSAQVDFISIQAEAEADPEFWASYDFDQSVLPEIENTYVEICQEAIDTVLTKDPEKICYFVNSEEWMDKLSVYDDEFAQLDVILQAAIDSRSEEAPVQ